MKRILYLILGVLTVLRFVAAGTFELTPQEADYYQWSQRPDLAYHSAGPGVAMTILASTTLWGTTELGVRLFSPLFGLATSLLIFAITRRIYDERAGFWAAILLQCVPVFNMAATVMTTAPLSIFFWAMTLYSFWRALENSPRWTPWWLLAGCSVGVGALCNYVNLVALISIILALILVESWRAEWRRMGIYSSILVAALCLLPIVFWNRTHGWITVTELSEGGFWSAGSSMRLELPFISLGRHFVGYSPFIFLGLICSFFCGLWNIRNHRKTAFLLCFSAPLIIFHFVISLTETHDAIWTGLAIFSLSIFATHDWLRRLERRPGFRVGAVIALLTGVGMTLFMRFPQGWKNTGQTVALTREEVETKLGNPVFLIANNYQMASELAWYLPKKPAIRAGDPPVYLPESQMIESQYSFWPGYDTFDDAEAHELDPFNTEEAGVNRFIGKDAVYLTHRADTKPAESVIRGFERWEYFGERDVLVKGASARKIRFFICYNYRTLPL